MVCRQGGLVVIEPWHFWGEGFKTHGMVGLWPSKASKGMCFISADVRQMRSVDKRWLPLR